MTQNLKKKLLMKKIKKLIYVQKSFGSIEMTK